MSAMDGLISLAEAGVGKLFSNPDEVLRFLEKNADGLRRDLVTRAKQHLLSYERSSGYSSRAFTGNELKFHSTSEYEIAVNMIEARTPSEFVSTLASDAIFLNLSEQDIQIDMYRLPERWSHEVFDPKARLVALEAHVLKPGAALSLDSGTYVPRIAKLGGDPTLLFKMAGTQLRSLIWNFSPDSLNALFTAASWVAGQRLKVAAKILGARQQNVDRQKTIPALRRILANENHDVRWAALESICLLDAGLGEELLKNAALDPHPHIATTARRTLARLGIA